MPLAPFLLTGEMERRVRISRLPDTIARRANETHISSRATDGGETRARRTAVPPARVNEYFFSFSRALAYISNGATTAAGSRRADGRTAPLSDTQWLVK